MTNLVDPAMNSAVETPTVLSVSSANQTAQPTAHPSVGGAQATALPRPAGVTGKINWRYALPIATIHLVALLAFVPWLFSWSGVVLMVVGLYVYGGLGINIAYHRLLTHRSFECPRWLEHFFVIVAQCCLEDVPATWVATHRLHHNHSDEQPDPHSPLVNFFWSHMGWLMVDNYEARSTSAYDRYARDVLRDPFYMRLQKTFLPVYIYLTNLVMYYVAGLLIGRWWLGDWALGNQLGLSWFVWGGIMRTICVWHSTWSVNSLTHVFGYRNYNTPENSRNNWLVALLSNGEGWHNNHHEDPASASNRHRWWEFDSIWVVIWLLEAVGLAKNVVRPRHMRRRAEL